MNSWPLPYQGSALPLRHKGLIYCAPVSTQAVKLIHKELRYKVQKPAIGIEPTTYGLQNRCSTVELCRLTEIIVLRKNLKVKSFLLYNYFVMIKYLAPIILLTISNIFMTFAWYGHLKFKAAPIIAVILVSWGIAFFEYCFQVPANRIGHEVYNAAQLKTIQEVITLIVFSFFSVLYLKEQFKWNYLIGFAFIILAVFFIFKKW